MAWEKRHGRTYYYRSVRRAGKVQKHYFGAGLAGGIAANTLARQRAQRQVAEQAWKQQQVVLDGADKLTERMYDWGQLLVDASLHAAGYHRHRRHAWKVWRHGRSALQHTP